MVEIADIFRLHGQSYREKFGDRMPKSHLLAMEAIEQCRTEELGGQVYFCESCNDFQYSYHSCKNRHCPKCQNGAANVWLEKQKEALLPVPHFLVTFTLPEELRDLARSNQQLFYNLLFRASSQALEQLALDPRFVGGKIGMVGVLHTWTRDLSYHPHVHYIVTGGGLSVDGSRWLSAKENFLVPVRALSILFRAKFRDELRKTELFNLVPADCWNKDWVVHSEPVGSGVAAFKYLAPYIFRVAISNQRILKLEDGKVTFQYKDSASEEIRLCTLSAEEFIRRFLQHVLPKGFVKVRYFGLLSSGNRQALTIARELLGCQRPQRITDALTSDPPDSPIFPTPVLCPKCAKPMLLVRKLPRRSRSP